MSTIGSTTLQSDENGLVTLQCDRCKSRFKMDCKYLNEELEGDICCPVCGISESLNTFWPEEVVEAAKRVAIMEAEQMIQDALKGIKSKHIKVKTTPIEKVDRLNVFRDKDFDMISITVQCCKKQMALTSADIVAGFYCPYCGRIIR